MRHYSKRIRIDAIGNGILLSNIGGIIVSSTGNLILAIMWILASPLWFLIEDIAVGIIWLCAGIAELIIGLIKRNKEKKNIL